VLGDTLDFTRVYSQHVFLVKRALLRHGARPSDLDDLTQEVFCIVERQLPEFEGRSTLETWLYAIAWRVAVAHRRRLRSQRTDTGDLPPVAALPNHGDEGSHGLHQKLAGLDEPLRDLVALRDIGGLSISELAELTASARATVRSRLALARKILARRTESAPGSVPDGPRANGAESAGFDASNTQAWSVDRAFCASRMGDVVIGMWRHEATVQAMSTLTQMMLESAAQWPDGIVLLSVLEKTARPPDLAVRRVVRSAAVRVEGCLRRAAWSLEATGVLRLAPPVINSSLFLVRSSITARFFTNVPSAASWLETGSRTATAADIATRVAHMRASLDAAGERAPDEALPQSAE
jgi:RNA polymerase sigma-70 factor (ECF subfamily)